VHVLLRVTRGGSKGAVAPIQKSGPMSRQMQWSIDGIVQCLCLSLVSCIIRNGADIENDLVLVTSAYSQYLNESCVWYLALIES